MVDGVERVEDYIHRNPVKRGLCERPEDYGIFTSVAYRATAPNAAFPQEKPHFADLSCSG